MTYETLAVKRVDEELIALARRGSQYRVISMPRGKLRRAAHAVRWTFRSAEVARRAFEFVVATERLWSAPGPSHRRVLDATARRTGIAFREAAMRHSDPPGVGGLADLMAAASPRRL